MLEKDQALSLIIIGAKLCARPLFFAVPPIGAPKASRFSFTNGSTIEFSLAWFYLDLVIVQVEGQMKNLVASPANVALDAREVLHLLVLDHLDTEERGRSLCRFRKRAGRNKHARHHPTTPKQCIVVDQIVVD